MNKRPPLAASPGLLGLVFLAFLSQGCSGSLGLSQSSSRPDQADIEELKRRILELQQQVTVHEVEIARLRQALAQPPRRQEGTEGSRRQSPETVPNSARGTLGAPLPERPTAIEESDLQPESYGTPRGGDLQAGGSPPSPTPGSALTGLPAGAQSLYDEGYTLYHQGIYPDAESTFRRFLELYGRTELADNAQYWIGECRFARQDFRGALEAFRTTVERYPEGNKVPDAILKAGQSLEKLGDLEGARITYEELVTAFPQSAAALNAEERLQSLR